MRAGVVLIACVFAGSASAAAPDAKETAGQLLEEGNRYFKRKQYEPALARYEAAYQVYPSPKILFNIASVHHTLGHSVKAIELFEQFLRVGGAAAGSKLHKEASEKIAALRAQVGRIAITSDALGTEVYLDSKPLGVAPIAEMWIAPGEHVIAGRLAGAVPFDATVSVAAGETRVVEVTMRAPDPPAPEPPAPELAVPEVAVPEPEPAQLEPVAVVPPPAIVEAPPPSGGSVLPWIVAGAGVVAAGAGVVFGVVASSRDDSARAEPVHARSVELAGSRDDFALMANVGFIAGGVLAVSGVVWALVD